MQVLSHKFFLCAMSFWLFAQSIPCAVAQSGVRGNYSRHEVGDFGPKPSSTVQIVDDGPVIHDFRKAPDGQFTPLGHNNLGVSLGLQKRFADAIREHKLAVEGEPDNAQFRRNLSASCLLFAISLNEKKLFLRAIEQYREALFADPHNGPAENGLNRILVKLGKKLGDLQYRFATAADAEAKNQYATAGAEYLCCTHIADSAVNNYRLGRVLFKVAGRKTEAQAALQKALEKDWPAASASDKTDCRKLLSECKAKP